MCFSVIKLKQKNQFQTVIGQLLKVETEYLFYLFVKIIVRTSCEKNLL